MSRMRMDDGSRLLSTVPHHLNSFKSQIQYERPRTLIQNSVISAAWRADVEKDPPVICEQKDAKPFAVEVQPPLAMLAYVLEEL